MFVDDLKVYAEGKIDLDVAIEVVEGVSRALGMELGLRKCAVAHMVQGTEVKRGGKGLKSGEEIRELEEGGTYRYLGTQQRFGADLNRTKQGVMKEYIGRTRRVWESGLNMGMKTEVQNSWATATMRYSLGTIGWCRSDAREMDRATRKIMRQNKAHQYVASVARLYQPRATGGRGLVSLEQAWETETVASVLYLQCNQDPQSAVQYGT